MQLLHDAKDNPSKGLDPNDKTIPADAIAALAKDLLEDGENFCECSSKASEGTFACTDFIHFKTLLYESIDACKSLDAIDCAAVSVLTPKYNSKPNISVHVHIHVSNLF